MFGVQKKRALKPNGDHTIRPNTPNIKFTFVHKTPNPSAIPPSIGDSVNGCGRPVDHDLRRSRREPVAQCVFGIRLSDLQKGLSGLSLLESTETPSLSVRLEELGATTILQLHLRSAAPSTGTTTTSRHRNDHRLRAKGSSAIGRISWKVFAMDF